MAITSAEIAALTDYTVAEQIRWVKAQRMEAARALATGAGNRNVTRQRLEDLTALLNTLVEEQQLDANGATLGIVLAEFGEEA